MRAKILLAVGLLVFICTAILWKTMRFRGELSCMYCDKYQIVTIKNFKFITLYHARRERVGGHHYCVCIRSAGFGGAISAYEKSCDMNIMDSDFSTSFVATGAFREAEVTVTDLVTEEVAGKYKVNIVNLNQRAQADRGS